MAEWASSSVAGSARCLPCVGQAIESFASHASLQLGLFTADAESWYHKFVQSQLPDEKLVGERLLAHRALHKAFLSHIVSASMHAVVAGSLLRNGPPPVYILLRASSAQEWSVRALRDFWYNHCASERRIGIALVPPVSAEDLRSIGTAITLPYAGVWAQCHGDVASFAPVLGEVPHFPTTSPVRVRPTYWKLLREHGGEDLLISSVDGLLQSLVACFEGVGALADAAAWLRVLSRCQRVCCEGDLGRILFLGTWSCFMHASAEEWMSRPAGLARPTLLCDYRALGAHIGLQYLGVRTGDRALSVNCIPPTVLSLTAVFGKEPPDCNTDWESFWESCAQTSYLQAHLQWQGRVPTFARMRAVLDGLAHNSGEEGVTLEGVLAEFPRAPRALVEAVFLEVQLACGHDAWDAQWAHAALDALLGEERAGAGAASKPLCQDVAGRVLQLRQAELRNGCNDLTHAVPPLLRGQPRRAASLAEQRLSSPMATGLRVAFHRGLRFLVADYSVELSKHAKHIARQKAVVAGELPATGEDVDLERRVEPLRLSPILLEHATSLAELHKCETQLQLWSVLCFLEDVALKTLTAEAQAHGHSSHLPKPVSESALASVAALFIDAPAPKRTSPGITPSQHELMLGFVVAMFRRVPAPLWQAPSTVSLRRKTNVASLRRSQVLLTIFATTSWVESTERWLGLPDPAPGAPRMVSNMDALEVRKLAKLVQDEREVSARPLVQHICAACGGLLGPRMPQRKTSEHETGKPGAAYQVLGKPCQAEVMPPFLLLFSKRLLGERLPAVFEYNASSNALRLRPETHAPWVHYSTCKAGAATMDLRHPWWYCKICWRYWQSSPSGKRCRYVAKPGALPETVALQADFHRATALQRIPMRNKMEGYFTAWHRDLAYCHLQPALRRLYPDHPTLPSVAEVLAWREARKANKARLQHALAEDAVVDRAEREAAFLEQARLRAQEFCWAPPARESAFGTPIPARHFNEALGSPPVRWSLQLPDLVPVEQHDLMQDAPACPALRDVCSADARACIALCRPVGQLVEKRQLPAKAGVLPTMPHQSGSLAVYPLLPAQDSARGMLSGVVAKESFCKEMFSLRPGEAEALASVLPWLQNHNPWLAAYKASLQEVCGELEHLQQELERLGRTLPGGLEAVHTRDGRTLQEALGEEEVALLLPVDAFKETKGSYAHLRAMADAVCTSSLCRSLPESWQQLSASSVSDDQGVPLATLPDFLDKNTSMTRVSFRDSHVESKLFVRPFPFGTGAYSSTLDCVTERTVYARSRFWSLGGEFLDDQDPHWLFWQREFDLKMRLWEDWRGKSCAAVTPGLEGADLSRGAARIASYSKATFSQRVGVVVPDSPQALTRQRHAWLEAARPENLGPPTSMTTFVGNPRAAAIHTHVLLGPCATPDPEQSLAFMREGRAEIPTTRYVALKEADYLRRRADFEMVAFDSGNRDALHGQVPHRCRKGENQKRGDDHDHYNVFCEPCGMPAHTVEVEGQAMPDALCASNPNSCRNVSRFCLRAGDHCRLPSCLNGAAFHMASHHAYAQAELVRPFPLGCPARCPANAPCVEGLDLGISRQRLEENLFASNARMQSSHTDAVAPMLPLWQRKWQALTGSDFFPASCGSVMTLVDVVAAYYYRALQIAKYVHVCKLGHCRQSWADACRFDLPALGTSLQQSLDAERGWTLPVRRYLPDDAFLKVHILDLTIRTLCNVQTNVHHPEAPNKSLCYSIKYQLKPEPAVLCEATHPADDAVTTYLRAQFVSLSRAASAALGAQITACTWSSPLAVPAWTAEAGNREWRVYTHRVDFAARPEDRDAWPLQIPAQALELSLLFAKFQTVARYFANIDVPHADAHASDDEDAQDNMLDTNCGSHQDSAVPPISGGGSRAGSLSARTWDSVPDKPTHPFYDPVLSMLLPGDVLQLAQQRYKGDVLRRVRNHRFGFGRFVWKDMAFQKDALGRTNRSYHFQSRLYAYLPWIFVTPSGHEVNVDEHAVAISPLPRQVRSHFEGCSSYLQLVSDDSGPVDFFYISPAVWSLEQWPTEEICMSLETLFRTSSMLCACCDRDVLTRCDYCSSAVGWHRCRERSCAWEEQADAFRWCAGTLWLGGVEDVFSCVRQLLATAASCQKIMDMLHSLYENDAIGDADLEYLQRYVAECTARVVDDNPMHPIPNQSLVLSTASKHLLQRSPKLLQAGFDALRQRMASLWSPRAKAYEPWEQVRPDRPPSQLLALHQLMHRFHGNHPIFVCIPPPAGFGKSELISAWLHFTALHGVLWEAIAPTGVAATQVAGSTLHNFGMLDTEGVSTLLQHPERVAHFQRVAGLIIDECMMTSLEAADALFAVCRQVPLREDLRRVPCSEALTFCGYRDLILPGDVRQIPPASGSRPFWSTAPFRTLFEIFMLHEDRRHERDPGMQQLKEKIAWGGSLPDGRRSADDQWPVDSEVVHFVDDGYLFGWGLSGANVDLESGTALFPRRQDVGGWNAACKNQVEVKYGDQSEAVDIHGYDWRGSCPSKPDRAQMRRLHGIQTPEVLTLRTCHSHRMRLLLLYNQDVENGWANGTRVRTLANASWAGKARPLYKGSSGVYEAAKVHLDDVSARDFSVRVVKDEEATVAKRVRFQSIDVQCIPARNDQSAGNRVAWRQVQLALAYAMTVHKAQGLTMYLTYPALTMVFGFGLPYSMCTRTPRRNNMWFVGVPPFDVYQRLVARDASGSTLIDRKRHEIDALLSNPAALQQLVESKVDSGEINLEDVAVSMSVDKGTPHALLASSSSPSSSSAVDACALAPNSLKVTPP